MLARIQLLFLVLLPILFCVESAVPSDIQVQDESPCDDEVSANINKAFDMALPGIKKLFLKIGFDPLKMDDFHQHLAGILIHNGEFDLSDGWLQGIADVVRTGDVIMSYKKNLLSLDMMLGLDVVEFESNYLFQYGLIRREGEVTGLLHDLHMRIVISLNLDTFEVVIDYLKVLSVGEIYINLEGHLLDPLLNIAIDAITVLFRQHVMKIVERAYEMIFQQMVNDINKMIPLPDKFQGGNNVFNYTVPPVFRDYTTSEKNDAMMNI